MASNIRFYCSPGDTLKRLYLQLAVIILCHDC
jgi:hypothetical protein